MNGKEKYFMLRRKKRIKLKQIADFLNCSITLISRYENDDVNMSKEKIEGYKNFIDEYEEGRV